MKLKESERLVAAITPEFPQAEITVEMDPDFEYRVTFRPSPGHGSSLSVVSRTHRQSVRIWLRTFEGVN